MVRQRYPDGEVVHTTYDLRGLPVAVAGQSPYLTAATYDALGRPLRQTWGNGRATTYAYHPQNLRLTQLTVSGNLLDLRYAYDRVGNVVAITDTVNGGQVQTFGYDARDRLVWARTNGAGSGPYNETYGYDRMGNILTRTVGGEEWRYGYGTGQTEGVTPPVASGPWRVYLPLVLAPPAYPPLPARTGGQLFAVVSTTAGFRAAYDPNGNMLLRVEVAGTQRITYLQEYDAENRLAAVTHTVTGEVVRFVYDGDGHRILRIGPEGTTVTIGDHYEQTGGTVRKYYYAGGGRVAMREGGILYFLHGDHLGSATLTTDVSGNRVGELRYTPYGVTRYEWGNIPTDRRYTGQRWEGFGLYDYGARMYSPSLGRWASADTIVPDPWNPQSLNRYAYVYNNPVGYIDADGHAAIVPVLIVAGVVVLKAVDYGWTAYDVYQSGRLLANPKAGRGEKLLAGLNIALAVAFEAGEPDDKVPVSLPLDDLGRQALMTGARQAFAEGGEEALERYLRERLGAQADEVLGWVMREVGEETAQEATGHWHHVLSTRIMRELDKHPTLQSVFSRDDIVVRALDEASHRGYQRWHRAYDREVVEWLTAHDTATREEFLRFLRDIYSRPDMRQRFPDALNPINRLLGGP